MAWTAHEVEAAATHLSEDERVRLAERLLASVGDDAELGKEWDDEIDRRMEEYRAGRLKTVPADEAIARIRAKLGL